MPPNWEERLIKVSDNNGSYSHYAIEIHDIASAKLSAGRDKDFEFLIESIHRKLIDAGLLACRFESLRETAFGGAVDDRKLNLVTKLEEAGLNEAASYFK